MSAPYYLFCDLETTGLDSEVCSIIEIAAILTTGPEDGFEEITRYECFVGAHRTRSWQRPVLDMHQNSGLLDDYDHGPRFSPEGAETGLLNRFQLCTKPRLIFAARNPHFDRAFIDRHMPRLAGLLHYQQFDITTVCAIDPTLYDYDHGVEGVPHRAMYDVERDLEYAREFARRYGMRQV